MTDFWVVLFLQERRQWLPLRFSFLLCSVSLPFLFALCVRGESFWSVLSNSPALDKYYDGKGPGTRGWLDPSFLGFFALFLLWFCLCFYSGFPLFFWVFLPCFCFRSSLPASVFFPGSWPVRPSLFSGFFLWVFTSVLSSGFRSHQSPYWFCFSPLLFGPLFWVFFSLL